MTSFLASAILSLGQTAPADLQPVQLIGQSTMAGHGVVEPQSGKAAVRVATFQGDRAGAISYTFDDGLRKQYLLAAPILNELGLHATFFIVPNCVTNTKAEAEAKKPGEMGGVSWDELREMAAKGQEIGNHTWGHWFPKNDDVKAEEEISKADQKIQQEIGVFPLSFCYPGNDRDPHRRELVLRHHVEAREYETRMGHEHTTPVWLNAWADRQAAEHKWGVAMIHGITEGYDPIDPDVLRAHLTYVKEHQNDLWVDTFGNIARYVRERDAAQLQVIGKTANSVTFILDTPLTRPPFDAPLTTVIAAPGATTAEAKTRDGRTLPAMVSQGALHVECVPGPEPVTVTWPTR